MNKVITRVYRRKTKLTLDVAVYVSTNVHIHSTSIYINRQVQNKTRDLKHYDLNYFTWTERVWLIT